MRALVRRFWPMLVGICVGSTPGAGFLANDTSGRASMALGVMLVAYALMSMVSPRLSVPPHTEWWLAPVVGAITGLIAILTGVFVLPLVPYLQSLGLQKDELIQALGLSLLISANGARSGARARGRLAAGDARRFGRGAGAGRPWRRDRAMVPVPG